MLKSRIRIVCGYCGSDDCGREASAKWNAKSQAWELCGTMEENTWCDGCSRADPELVEIVIEPEGV